MIVNWPTAFAVAAMMGAASVGMICLTALLLEKWPWQK